MINAWPKHPNLKSFKITTVLGNVDLALHRRVLSLLSPHFPALRHCYLTDYVEWSFSESDRVWKPEVVFQEELNILSMAGHEIGGQEGSECFSRLEAFKNEVNAVSVCLCMSAPPTDLGPTLGAFLGRLCYIMCTKPASQD